MREVLGVQWNKQSAHFVWKGTSDEAFSGHATILSVEGKP